MLGCINLGFLEDKKGNIVKAQSLYKKACDGGDMKGFLGLDGRQKGKSS